jgi:hypothetical protein
MRCLPGATIESRLNNLRHRRAARTSKEENVHFPQRRKFCPIISENSPNEKGQMMTSRRRAEALYLLASSTAKTGQIAVWPPLPGRKFGRK